MPNSKLFLASVEAAEKASWEDRMANILAAAAACRVQGMGLCSEQRQQAAATAVAKAVAAPIGLQHVPVHARPSHLFLARRGTPEASRNAERNTGCRALLAGPPAGVTDWHSSRSGQ